MNLDETAKRKVDALIHILEGEVMLLRDTVHESMHWNDARAAQVAISKIQSSANKILLALGIEKT
jgi:hypothetical protein